MITSDRKKRESGICCSIMFWCEMGKEKNLLNGRKILFLKISYTPCQVEQVAFSLSGNFIVKDWKCALLLPTHDTVMYRSFIMDTHKNSFSRFHVVFDLIFHSLSPYPTDVTIHLLRIQYFRNVAVHYYFVVSNRSCSWCLLRTI